MCGRFALTAPPEDVQALFGYRDAEPFPPRYNIAPTQPVAVVRRLHGERRLTLMRWGLVPAFVKDPGSFPLLFNARSESAAGRPAFVNALRYRRCLFPASGFYEWRRGPGDRKQPFWVRPRSPQVLALAGLWETWSDRDGGEIDTAAILTTGASATLSVVHDRMPVIVAPADFERWLRSTGDPGDDVGDLMRAAPDALLEAIPVGPNVNNAANDGPELQTPIAPGDTVPRPAKRDLFDP
jgi:putative SOS response-associated peptidase YedK